MPRQDVPYGGAICRLRERIAEIWDELGKKLHSINGVEGDGQGNVLIRSDNAALTITDDQVQHEIVLDLDTSQLPAADVNSVNNQVGVVVLTADDIPSDNGDVQTDLDNLAAADITLQGNINAEALARQNADSTLQTNINAALATIPGEVTSQIASNVTIAQLVTADGQNVKLTGNQNISGVKTVPTEAIGNYSQQIANSNKIRNELYTYGLTTTTNQNYTGIKTLEKTHNVAPISMKITDKSNIDATIYLSGITNATNDWFVLDYMGKETDPRQYFNKRIRLQDANFDIRFWVDASGNIAIGIYNPILQEWKQVVLQ